MYLSGSTLLFVSHASDTVRSLCSRAIWLDHGVKRADGPSDEVCTAYEQATAAGTMVDRGTAIEVRFSDSTASGGGGSGL